MHKILGIACICSFLMSAFVFADTTTTTQPHKKKAKRPPVADQVDSSLGGQGYGTAGCGLGSIVFGEKTGPIQIVAATLNGTGMQTFGISTGTSNCKADDRDTGKSAALFITVNHEMLAKDISRGNGETIDSLSQIVGCSDSKMLGTKLQQNFNSIFPNRKMGNPSSPDSGDAQQTIFRIIKSDGTLAKNCSKIG